MTLSYKILSTDKVLKGESNMTEVCNLAKLFNIDP